MNEKASYKLVPIHSIRLLVVVTDSVRRSRAKRNPIFGPFDAECSGLCSWDEGFRVALFFTRRDLCHELLAHETFHATHRILEHQGIVFSPGNHEPFALLHGWLSAHVYREIDRMGEKIAAGYPARKYIPGEPRLRGKHLDE